jgi:hypothetical protein
MAGDSNASDSASVASTTFKTTGTLEKFLQKCIRVVQTEENKKMLSVFLLDPILNYVLERLFPYMIIFSVLFILLTIMISLTLLLVFTRLPAALSTSATFPIE